MISDDTPDVPGKEKGIEIVWDDATEDVAADDPESVDLHGAQAPVDKDEGLKTVLVDKPKQIAGAIGRVMEMRTALMRARRESKDGSLALAPGESPRVR